MVQEHTVYQQIEKSPSPDESRLVLEDTAGKREIKLEKGQQYLLGRGKEADIRIDDQRLSRRHAEVRQEKSTWVLVDLGSTNGTTANGRRIDRLVLQDGSRFQVGDTGFLFVASSISKPSRSLKPVSSSAVAPAKQAPRGRLLLIVSLMVVLLIGGLFLLRSMKKTSVGRSTEIGGKADDVLVPVLPVPGQEASVAPVVLKSKSGISSDVDKSREHYRVGLLFYDSGHLKKAIEEWDLALAYNRDNALVRRKLSRAVAELDEKIEEYYRQALVHLKYYRFHEARQCLQIVVELVRDKQDERYKAAQEKLKVLEKK